MLGLHLEHGATLANSVFRLCQMVGGIVVLAYYATPLKKAAQEHKYTDGKFVYATVLGSASLATALPLFIIPLVNQSRGISVLFFWEILIVILWVALFITFRGFFTENPEMGNGIKKMKIAVWFDVACAILWVITAARSTYVFFTNIFKEGMFTVGRPKKKFDKAGVSTSTPLQR